MSEIALTESRTMRAQTAGRVDVLDKVKALALLPDGVHADIPSVATYFEVDVDAIESIIRRNRDELSENGMRVLRGAEYRAFVTASPTDANPKTRSLTVLTRRAILNVGQLLTESEVARQVRTFLLDAEAAPAPAALPDMATPEGRRAVARLLLESTEREIALTEKVTAAEREIQVMAPLVAEWQRVADARGLIHPAVFAQQSGIRRPNGKPLGQNTAIKALRELRVLKDAPGTDRHNTPYQDHVHRIKTIPEPGGVGVHNVPYVRPEHAHYLRGRILGHLYPAPTTGTVLTLPTGTEGRAR